MRANYFSKLLTHFKSLLSGGGGKVGEQTYLFT